MQTSVFVRHLRLVGLVIGFLLFAFMLIRWVQQVTDVSAVHRSPLSAHATIR